MKSLKDSNENLDLLKKTFINPKVLSIIKMVSHRTILVMIVIAVLLLGASLLISLNIPDDGSLIQGNVLEGNQEGSINLIINPPATGGTGENG